MTASTMDTAFRYQTDVQEGVVTLRLSGSASMDYQEAFASSLMQTLEHKAPLTVIDMADLAFICSLGLGSLVDAARRARQQGGILRLHAPRPEIAKLFSVTRLDQVLEISAAPAPGSRQ